MGNELRLDFMSKYTERYTTRVNFIVYKLYFNKPNLKKINFIANQTQDGGILLSNKKGMDYLLQPQPRGWISR